MRLKVAQAMYRIRNFSFIAQTRDILYRHRIAYCKPPTISNRLGTYGQTSPGKSLVRYGSAPLSRFASTLPEAKRSSSCRRTCETFCPGLDCYSGGSFAPIASQRHKALTLRCGDIGAWRTTAALGPKAGADSR